MFFFESILLVQLEHNIVVTLSFGGTALTELRLPARFFALRARVNSSYYRQSVAIVKLARDIAHGKLWVSGWNSV